MANKRIGVLLFGVLFALLFTAVALSVGIGSSAPVLPRNAVALLEGLPTRGGVITRAQLNRELRRLARVSGLQHVPEPGDPEYESLKTEALDLLLAGRWFEYQVRKWGMPVTHREIVDRMQPSETKSLRKLGFNQKELEERMRWQIATDHVQERLSAGISAPSRAEVRADYEESWPEGEPLAEAEAEIGHLLEQQRLAEVLTKGEAELRGEWQSRTYCAEGFVTEWCSNFPPFSHPFWVPPACYEADPRTPPEECSAPVPTTRPALPGSVRWWRPQGEQLAQGPVPPGGGKAEASGE